MENSITRGQILISLKPISIEELLMLSKGCTPLIYRITGGLGNALFALSEAHLLSRAFHNPIFLDWSNFDLSHTKGDFSDFNIMQPMLSDWVSGNFNLNASASTLKNLKVQHVMNPRALLPNQELTSIHRDSFVQKREIKTFSPILVQGWNPDLKRIKSGSLFTRGQFPISDNALQFAQREYTQFDHYFAMHLRLGDYAKSGSSRFSASNVVENYYLHRSLLQQFPQQSKVLIFSDSVVLAKELLAPYEEFYQLEFAPHSLTPIQTLRMLSGADRIICSGSTFSFWASYFSKSTCLFPKPFFWDKPNWEKSLIKDPSWKVIRRDKLWTYIWRRTIFCEPIMRFRKFITFTRSKMLAF